MAQFVQLQQNLNRFHDAGIGVVGMTYDAPDVQQAFVDKNKILYPLISDIDAFSVSALGIVNEQYQPGDKNYGIPHPGIYVLDTEQKIVGKVFIDGFQTRLGAEALLEYAQSLLSNSGP